SLGGARLPCLLGGGVGRGIEVLVGELRLLLLGLVFFPFLVLVAREQVVEPALVERGEIGHARPVVRRARRLHGRGRRPPAVDILEARPALALFLGHGLPRGAIAPPPTTLSVSPRIFHRARDR